MYNSLTLIKKHLNIDSSFTDDDEYLCVLEDVAEKAIQRNICCVLADLEDGEGKIPSPLCQAVLLYVGVLYNSREAISYGGSPVEVPYTLNYLVSLYKNYADNNSDNYTWSVLDDLARALTLIDTPEELVIGDDGHLVIDTDKVNIDPRAITIADDGTLKVNIERI